MAFGVDFSWARPSVASLKRAGVTFVGRYLNQPGGKGLTKAEYQSYVSAGIAVYTIYEETGRELLGGTSAGERVARSARAALRALGLGDRPVFFAVDFAAGKDQLADIADALDGAASVLGRNNIGVYGSADVIDALVPVHAAWGFQTYAWSHGRVSKRANIYQYRNGQTIGGGSVDFNHSLTPDFGALSTLPISAVSDGGYNLSSHSVVEIQAVVGVTQDGIYGPLTAAAVRTWQKAHGLIADGIVGPQTEAKMFPAPKPVKAAKPAKTAPADVVVHPHLKVDGDWGPETTKALQRYLDVTADGQIGPVTIKALQRLIHVKADGILGPVTRKALQRRLHIDQDGIWGRDTTRALQRALNAGKL